MGKVKLDFTPKFEQTERIAHLQARNRELALSGKRKLGGWGPTADDDSVTFGDHACWINIGPFPQYEELPSRKNGYEMTALNWAGDYAFLLDHTPANIHPHERIVGEIYWEMHQVRRYNWADCGDEVTSSVQAAHELGAYGMSTAHTCPDFMIGLTQGYACLLKRIRDSLALYERVGNEKKVNYLQAMEMVCQSCTRYIYRYAEEAEKQAEKQADNTDDPTERGRFQQITDCCRHIAENPPRNYYEAVQWIHFAILFDRTIGHGNGYGSLDVYLGDFYDRGMIDGSLTRTDAREYLAEMYMKLRGHFFCVGGRDENGRDATREMSWVVLEAYDLVGDYNNLGVMWHNDMDEAFYTYACDVLARHGESIPVLANYDMMYEAEIRSGIPHKHAWQVAYCGCQWFCIPGREFCDQDSNSFVALKPMQRAINRAVAGNIDDFETLYSYFKEETAVTAKAMQNYKREHDRYLGDLWPEIYTSIMSHGPIERGMDMVAPRGVDYQYTSVNVLGIPNVADAFHAIKKLVYEKKQYTLEQVKIATENNWEGEEPMRLRFYNEDKYGNDIDEVDTMFARVCETIREEMEGLYNQKGQPFRPSLFHFQGHTSPEEYGATADGRKAADYLAHGVNPTGGVNVRGLIPSANSLTAIKSNRYQGAPLQVDLQPRFFDGKEEIWKYIRNFSAAFFKMGGMQINLHLMDLSKLADAIDHPENPEYQNIIVRVTGYASRFVTLPKDYQLEFVARNNYTP